MKNHATDTIEIFIPLIIKKRGGAAMVVIAKNADPVNDQKCFDEKMIKALPKPINGKLCLMSKEFHRLPRLLKKKI